MLKENKPHINVHILFSACTFKDKRNVFSLPATAKLLKKAPNLLRFHTIFSPKIFYAYICTHFVYKPRPAFSAPFSNRSKSPPVLAKPNLVVYITVKAGQQMERRGLLPQKRTGVVRRLKKKKEIDLQCIR